MKKGSSFKKEKIYDVEEKVIPSIYLVTELRK